MKEKTLKDLGIDNGDKFLGKLSTEYDLGDLENILNGEKLDTEETNKKIEDIKKDI